MTPVEPPAITAHAVTALQTTMQNHSSAKTSSTAVTTTTTAAAKTKKTGLLSSPADVKLHDLNGKKCSYAFSYNGKEFRAEYTAAAENWKIIDSYEIYNSDDQMLICEALIAEHPIHGKDKKSWRTAEDLAYEWGQHNLAYSLLPDGAEWKKNAKDVDLNPEDQRKSILDFYRDRSGYHSP